MIKKQKSRRRKRIVVVKRKSNVAKNSNNIIIRIDNSNKRKGNSQRKIKQPQQPEPPEPQKITVTRNYQDIGNYTDEIVKRNKAIQDEREAKSTYRLPTPVMEEPTPVMEEPIITPPKIKRDEVMGKSTSRLPTMTINPLDTDSPIRKTITKLSSQPIVSGDKPVEITDAIATPLKALGEKQASHFIVRTAPDRLLSYKNTKANLTRAQNNNYEILKFVNMTEEQERQYQQLYTRERVQIHRNQKKK